MLSNRYIFVLVPGLIVFLYETVQMENIRLMHRIVPSHQRWKVKKTATSPSSTASNSSSSSSSSMSAKEIWKNTFRKVYHPIYYCRERLNTIMTDPYLGGGSHGSKRQATKQLQHLCWNTSVLRLCPGMITSHVPSWRHGTIVPFQRSSSNKQYVPMKQQQTHQKKPRITSSFGGKPSMINGVICKLWLISFRVPPGYPIEVYWYKEILSFGRYGRLWYVVSERKWQTWPC